MKKYVMLIAFTVTAVSWILVAPMLSKLQRVSVSGIRASLSTASSVVSCTGITTASHQQVINYGISVIPENIYVDVGDNIQTGQKLMDIDKVTTVEAFKSLSLAQSNSDQESTTDSNDTQITTDDESVDSTDSSDDSDSSDSSESEAVDSSIQIIQQSKYANDVPAENIPDTVYSTISGVVTQVNATSGSFSQAASPLIIVSDLSSMQIKAQVDENMISQVRVGQKVSISGDSFSKKYTGKVTKIYPSATTVIESSGKKTVVNVLISIDNADSSVIPGLSSTIEINTGDSTKSVLLPYESIEQDKANKQYVYIYQNGQAIRRYIKVGKEYVNNAEIISGVNAGDIVITNKISQLKNGIHVKLKKVSGDSNV